MPKFAELVNQPVQLKQKNIDVPEWGGTFCIHEVTGLQHQEITEKFSELTGDNPTEAGNRYAGKIAAILLSRCLVDEDGDSPTEEWLILQPISLLNKLSAEAMDINGLSAEARAEIEKNS